MRHTLTIALVIAGCCFPSSAPAVDEFNVRFGAGKSMTSWHGQASFKTVELEVLGRSRFVERWLPKTRVGASLAHHEIRQPRSWFGYRFGDPDISVSSQSAFLFLRRDWRGDASVRPYLEIGTGPMVSNQQVPAATSHFNFNSQGGLGVVFFANKRPVHVVYRFSHISNLMFGDSNPGFRPRNPGWNVSSLLIGARVRRMK